MVSHTLPTRPARTRRQSRRAVALIDAIVAAVILGVALSLIISLGSQAINSQRTGEELQTAAMLADEQLNLVLARGPDDYAKRFGTSGTCEPPLDNYRYSLAFSEGTGGRPYRVSATIVWTSAGKERTLVIEALMAPRGGTDPDPDRRPQNPVERLQ